MSDELAFKGAVELGRLIAKGKLSSLEATQVLLARIERLEPSLHAYAQVTATAALAEAKRADREIAKGTSRGPLHGVPLGVKDLCDMAGSPTGAGIPFFRETLKQTDSTVVARLRAAGAVVIGKTQLTEGALSTHHPQVPVPVNPWGTDLWPGVSSSGSGVAVASGLAYGALGSDTGGSIRFPSQANRLVGVKPTWGRVSRAGVFPLAESLDHIGPMTRRVEDAAAILQAISGADPRDSTAAPVAVPDFMTGLRKGIKGVRIAYDRAACRDDVAPEITAAVARAARVLKAAGAEIVPARLPDFEEPVSFWAPLCATEAALAHAATYPAREAEYGPVFGGFLGLGNSVPATTYAKGTIARRVLAGEMAALFERVDLVLMPVMPMLSGTHADLDARIQHPRGANPRLHFTAPADLTGHPTITLPAGAAANGSGIGFQLVARHFDEALLLRAGMAWQSEASLPATVPPLAT